MSSNSRLTAQIALEFIIVYSLVLIVFVALFALITAQRATSLQQQQYLALQLEAQNIAQALQTAASAPNGYVATITLSPTSIAPAPYNISLTTTGGIVVSTTIGNQVLRGYALSGVSGLSINGTQKCTANGCLTQIPSYSGVLKLATLNGKVYVGSTPPSVLDMAGTIQQHAINTTSAARFSGPISSIAIPATQSLALKNLITVSAWVYPTANTPAYEAVIGTNGMSYIALTRSGSGYNVVAGVNTLNQLAGVTCTGGIVNAGQLSFLSMTYNGAAVAAYYNATQVCSAPASGALVLGSTLYIGANSAGTGQFTGDITNVQLYNDSLTVASLGMIKFQNGVGGLPLNANTLSAWWPLAGNANDYAAHGNDGMANAISYDELVYLNLTAQSYQRNQAFSAGIPIGIASSTGTLSSYGSFVATRSFSLSNQASAYLLSNGSAGTANVTEYAFNGNLSTIKSLEQWWPLSQADGNITYDFAGNYFDGLLGNGAIWQTEFANLTATYLASFPGNPSGTCSPATCGWISIPNAQSLSGVESNGSFTAVAWVYFKGATAHQQGIFGDAASTAGPGFQIEASGGSGVLNVNGISIPWPASSTNIPSGSWQMVTAVYNGNTGIASVYLNDSLYASAQLGASQSLNTANNYNIGNDAWQATGSDNFNGLITNVQLYDMPLQQARVSQLYAQGIDGSPLQNMGSAGWWPLYGNTIDWSSGNATGVINSNVVFINVNVPSTVPTTPALYLNGMTANVQQQQGFAFMDNAIQPFTISIWVYPQATNGVIVDELGQQAYTPYHDAWISLMDGNVVMSVWTGTSLTCKTIGAIAQNKWSHIVVTAAKSGATNIAMNGYINGVLKASQTVTRSVAGAGSTAFFYPLGLGDSTNCGGSSGAFFTGELSDYQIYDAALTSTQVQQLYVQGNGLTNQLSVSLS